MAGAYDARLSGRTQRAIVYLLSVGGLGIIAYISLGFADFTLREDFIFQPLSCVIIGTGFLVFLFTHRFQATWMRITLGIVALVVVTVSIVTVLTRTHPTTPLGVVLQYSPISLAFLAGFVSKNSTGGVQIGHADPFYIQHGILALALLLQGLGFLLIHIFIIPPTGTLSPLSGAWVLFGYQVWVVYLATVWVISFPIYYAGRSLA